jgi:hypothetical protein
MVMKITSKNVAIVAVEVDGELSSVRLLPGEHKYNLDLHNERTYEDLRMLSEDMGIIEIDGGLPSKEALAKHIEKLSIAGIAGAKAGKRLREAFIETCADTDTDTDTDADTDTDTATEEEGFQVYDPRNRHFKSAPDAATEEDDA